LNNLKEISSFVESIDQYSTDELRTKLSIVLADKMLAETVGVEPTTNYVSVPGTEKETGTVAVLRKYKKN
jgi:hypothetical protein